MTTFTKIIDKFRREAWSERDKGFRFERLMQAYLKATSLYAGRFEEVWLWSEFPCHDQFGGKDIGIDLVTKTFSGEYWAVQCKCYADDSYITKPDVDTFLSATNAENQQIAKQTPSFTPKNVKSGVFVLFKIIQPLHNKRVAILKESDEKRLIFIYPFTLIFQDFTSS